MDSEAIRTPGSIRLKRDLSREAVNLALQGEWERATEVNKDILELFAGDVEAMNRLVKALIELGSYLEARGVLNQVCEVAPYNNIAKKNLVRLDQLTANPGSANPGNPKQTKKTAGAPDIFIEESGKSTATILRNTTSNKAVLANTRERNEFGLHQITVSPPNLEQVKRHCQCVSQWPHFTLRAVIPINTYLRICQAPFTC